MPESKPPSKSTRSSRRRVLSFRPNDELAKRIENVVSKSYNSPSDFLADAAAEKVRRIETDEAFGAAEGAWSRENHPDLATEEDIRTWVREIRGHIG